MSTQVQMLIDSALALPAEDRAVIAERILDSLNGAEPAIDAEWAQEAEDRLDAYDRGEIRGIPFDEAMRDLRENRP